MRKIDTRSSQVDAVDQHHRNTTWPIAWKAKAFELDRAFHHLSQLALGDVERLMADEDREGPSVTATALMLGGFVVENLLKGLIARDKGVPMREGMPKFTSHTLVGLAGDAGLSLTYEEQVLLQRLTEFVLWKGRYPAPQKIDALRGYTLENGGFGSLVSMSPAQDIADTASFIKCLFAKLG